MAEPICYCFSYIAEEIQREGEINNPLLKNNLRDPDGAASRLKMLTYYMYAPLSRCLTPCQEP